MSHSHGHADDPPLASAVDHAAVRARAPTANARGYGPGDDPTATKTLRARYAAEMYRRFRALKGAVRESVIGRDAFGLTDSGTRANVGRPTTNAQDADIDIAPAGRNEFSYPTDARKVDAFQTWLDTQADRGILEVSTRRRSTAATATWQDTYIRSAYEEGVTHADDTLVRAGVIPPEGQLESVFAAPKHADTVGLAFTRAYQELDGVTNAMGQQMTRELADGLAQGENPRKIARRLNDRVDKIGITRGRLIARTEVLRAHNGAALNRYEDMRGRIEGVTLVAEHVTAGDARVCPECAALAGRTYSIEEARGRLPVHARCRCTFVPVLPSDR